MGDGRVRLDGAGRDRAAGVLLGMACGDALGAGYEFRPPLPAGTPVEMSGGGSLKWEPGEWTDDTSMAIPIAQAAAAGLDLRDESVLDGIVARWVKWARSANDVGVQTRAVLSDLTEPTAAAAELVARRVHERSGRSGGNGSLMRTAPVALACLGDRDGLMEAATRISGLTHHDRAAGEACVIWCLGIRHAVLHGSFEGVRGALDLLPAGRRDFWAARLDEAEAKPPEAFDRNGWVVQALQGAWSAITRTPTPDPACGGFPGEHLRLALEAAVRGGWDADTVAAIAGGLLGARWGASAVPLGWQRVLHGWPGLRARDLIALGVLASRGGHAESSGWPAAPVVDYSRYGDLSALAAHPHDPGVRLAGVGALSDLPAGVDAVVSLCRLGAGQVPASRVAPGDHVEVWLVDREGANANLDLVLTQAADVVAALRKEGRTVLLHCVQAHSRTPTVAALYATRHLGMPPRAALAAVQDALPHAHPNSDFIAALCRLPGSAEPPAG